MAHEARTSRPLGFYVAVAVALLCVAAIGVISIRALRTPPREPQTANDPGSFAGGLTGQDVRGSAKGLHIRVMDRDERDRLAAELESETIDPLQAQRYRVSRPRATIYLEDGRLVRITADGGTLVMPDRAKAPETGTLRGNVLVRLFDEGVSPADVASDRATPSLTWSGSTLTFDSTLGEVSTGESFVLTSHQFEFRASDAKLLINQTLERLERFSVRKGGTLVYHEVSEEPGAPADAPRDAGAQRPPAPDGATPEGAPERDPAAPPAQPPEPVETLYLAAMTGAVRLERAGQTIESDRLDLFARTIDNKLPPGAIASVDVHEPPQGEEPDTPPDPEQGAPPPEPGTDPQDGDAGDESPGEEAPPEGAASESTTLTWTDALEIRPLADEPPELSENHVVARFTSGESGVVRFADAVADNASGQAALVEYAMTTRELVLGGPAQQNVSLKSADMGENRMSRIELNLATGEAFVPGPYTAIGADGISRADCGERAYLRFKMVNGRMTGELVEAELVGNARATDGEGWIEAGVLHAFFDDDADGESRLRRLVAATAVRISDGRGAEGAWEQLEVAFEPDGQTPTSVDAGGGGNFRDRTARVDAGHLFAQLRRAESGSIEIAKVWADGGVKLRRTSDEIDIAGEALFADADLQFLEVEQEGGEATVSRAGTLITGERVRLHGVDRTAEVDGAGSFTHRAGEAKAASVVLASWTEGMAFDDVAGRLDCLGDVEAVHEPDPLTRDTISAHALRVELEPASEAQQAAGAEQTLASETEDDREILAVYAAGPAFFGLGDGLATIESARYAAPPAGQTEQRALERAFRLSGVEIFADNTARTLDVPGRGRLFVADLRAPAPEEQSDAERGAALFDWKGSLHVDRAAGTGQMLESVEMSHTRAADGAKTLLECARLRATFFPDGGDEASLGGLRSAIADTHVYLRTDTRELTADLLEYDPEAGVARALADDAGRVRMLDRTTGAPMSAAALVWDLNTDRVDVVDPGTITIPR